MKPTNLENSAQIEQLSFLINRIFINTVEVEDDGISVDSSDGKLIKSNIVTALKSDFLCN